MARSTVWAFLPQKEIEDGFYWEAFLRHKQRDTEAFVIEWVNQRRNGDPSCKLAERKDSTILGAVGDHRRAWMRQILGDDYQPRKHVSSQWPLIRKVLTARGEGPEGWVEPEGPATDLFKGERGAPSPRVGELLDALRSIKESIKPIMDALDRALGVAP